MKVFLCKSKSLRFTFPKNVSWERKNAAVWQRKRESEVDLVITKNDVAPHFDQNILSQNDWRNNLNKFWSKTHSNKMIDLVNQQPGDLACLKVTLDHLPGGHNPPINHDQLSFHVEGKLLQDIRVALGVHDVRLQMELFDAHVQSVKRIMQLPRSLKRLEPMVNALNEMVQHFNHGITEEQLKQQNQFDTKWTKCNMDMPIKSVPNNLKLAYCEEQIALPKSWRQNLVNLNDDSEGDQTDMEFSVKTTLIVSVVEPEIHEKKNLYMDSKFEDDVEIVASNGKVITCKGSCVKEQSKLLKIIIEENENKLEMTDMSEQGVRAFLAYIYCKDLSVPLQVFSVAVELFQIAEKYSIRLMEKEMKNVLLGKPYLWFDDVNSALRLLLFVAKLPDHSDLKWKTLRVLKSMPVDMVVKSQIYQQLFQENQQASNKLEDAKQLCDALLSLPMVDVMSVSKL